MFMFFVQFTCNPERGETVVMIEEIGSESLPESFLYDPCNLKHGDLAPLFQHISAYSGKKQVLL